MHSIINVVQQITVIENDNVKGKYKTLDNPSVISKSSNKKNKSPKKQYKCNNCDRFFSSQKRYEQHTKNYWTCDHKCPMCNKQFQFPFFLMIYLGLQQVRLAFLHSYRCLQIKLPSPLICYQLSPYTYTFRLMKVKFY